MKRDEPVGLDGIVLVRLLVKAERVGVSKLAESICPLFGFKKPEARRAFEASLARLKDRGFIWPDTKLILTEEGEKAALAEIGYSGLPQKQRTDWRWAKKALVIKHLSKSTKLPQDKAGKSDYLAALILAQAYDLALPKGLTPGAVLRALAWRALGSPDRGPLAQSAGAGAILGLLARAEEPPEQPSPAPETDDLKAFASRVNDAARATKKGRWLPHKVFIAQVWRHLGNGSRKEPLPLDRFKRRLTEAAHAGLVVLSGADIVSALPEDEARQSRTDDGERVYHFVETEHLG